MASCGTTWWSSAPASAAASPRCGWSRRATRCRARGRAPVRRRRVPADVVAGAPLPLGAAARAATASSGITLLRRPGAGRRRAGALRRRRRRRVAWSTPTRSTSRWPTSTTTRSGATSPTGAPSWRRTTTRRSGCSASRTYRRTPPPTGRCARWPSGWASATRSARRRSASTSAGRARRSPDPYFGGAGPDRTGCLHCGSCMTGCRHGAKNTLVKNYLWLAERAGAEVRPLTTVTRGAAGGRRRATRSRRCAPARWLRRRRRGVRGRPGDLRGRRAGHPAAAAPDAGRRRAARALRPGRRADPDQLRVDPRRDGAARRAGRATWTSPTGVAITSSFHPDPHTHIEPVRYGRGSNSMGLLQTLLVDGGPRRGRCAGCARSPGIR